MKTVLVFSLVIISCFAQRPPYAGLRPIGYPEIQTTTTTAAPGVLGNRFGEGQVPTTTVRLPLEALGDAALVETLSKLPVEHQPFWLLNWAALEANRNSIQTYPQKGNPFIDQTSNVHHLR